MATGFTPTQNVPVTVRVVVLMVLSEPVVGQLELGPEFRTYIAEFWAEVKAMGREPGRRLIVVIAPARVGKYWLTVSFPLLATYNDREDAGKASAMEPMPMVFTARLVSP